jgi:hypothetical protein
MVATPGCNDGNMTVLEISENQKLKKMQCHCGAIFLATGRKNLKYDGEGELVPACPQCKCLWNQGLDTETLNAYKKYYAFYAILGSINADRTELVKKEHLVTVGSDLDIRPYCTRILYSFPNEVTLFGFRVEQLSVEEYESLVEQIQAENIESALDLFTQLLKMKDL